MSRVADQRDDALDMLQSSLDALGFAFSGAVMARTSRRILDTGWTAAMAVWLSY